MLCEEDQQLFYAARAAQVNRNTAIYVFEAMPAEAAERLRGGLVRVLLELPASHNEDYALARITGTVEGVPYKGFSTNSNQETTTYLVLSLPRQLAELNGEQFQLNSVSNSTMNEAEFTRWLQMMRADGVPLPSVAELNSVAERVQPLDNARRPGHGSRAHRASLSGASIASAAPGNRQGAAVHSPSSVGASTTTLLVNPSQGLTAASNSNTPSVPVLPTLVAAGHASAGDPVGGRTASPTGSANYPGGGANARGAGATPVPSPQPASGDGPRPTQLQQVQQRQLARQGPPQSRDPAVGGASNHYFGGEGNEGGSGGFYGGGSTGGGVALQSGTMSTDTEETEADRRLRQDVLNHLQSSCTLFPRESSMYKLSQLRTVERDMIEFLEHVREEIASKQENCVVCMDHLPTVILLPCKHKALCRLCASTQASCPICRRVITEMFEPREI